MLSLSLCSFLSARFTIYSYTSNLCMQSEKVLIRTKCSCRRFRPYYRWRYLVYEQIYLRANLECNSPSKARLLGKRQKYLIIYTHKVRDPHPKVTPICIYILGLWNSTGPIHPQHHYIITNQYLHGIFNIAIYY